MTNQSWEAEFDNDPNLGRAFAALGRLLNGTANESAIAPALEESVKDFIRKELQTAKETGRREGREEAVEYIRKEFNDDRYAEMWPEDERDEDDSREGSAAEFWMFFNPILDEAMNPFNGDVCEKHQAPDCMPCFYTTAPQEHGVDTQGV